MTQFVYTPQNDGTLADVADINTPFQSVATVINGNLDSSNVAAGSLTADRMASSANPETRQTRNFADYVVSGLTIATSASLSSTITTGYAYITGKEINPAATPKTFTASKDTYVDLKNDGTFAYVEVANGATSGMTMTANALRIAKVVTSGSAVTAVYQNARIGGIAALTDLWAGFDPIGNPVYPRAGDRAAGRYVRTANTTTGAPGASAAAWNGCPAVPFIAEANRTYVFHADESVLSGFTGSGDLQFVLYLGATSGAQTTKLGQHYVSVSTASGLNGFSFDMTFGSASTTGTQYVSLYVTSSGWSGTMTVNTDVTNDRNGVYTIRRD